MISGSIILRVEIIATAILSQKWIFEYQMSNEQDLVIRHFWRLVFLFGYLIMLV